MSILDGFASLEWKWVKQSMEQIRTTATFAEAGYGTRILGTSTVLVQVLRTFQLHNESQMKDSFESLVEYGCTLLALVD